MKNITQLSREEDPDPFIFGLPDLGLLLFPSDPNADPTCNNGYIKLQNINQNPQIQA